jgi:hypothetical protein
MDGKSVIKTLLDEEVSGRAIEQALKILREDHERISERKCRIAFRAEGTDGSPRAIIHRIMRVIRLIHGFSLERFQGDVGCALACAIRDGDLKISVEEAAKLASETVWPNPEKGSLDELNRDSWVYAVASHAESVNERDRIGYGKRL